MPEILGHATAGARAGELTRLVLADDDGSDRSTAAAALASDWSARLDGAAVTVFTAAARITAGEPVEPAAAQAVRPARPGPGAGIACHDARTGGLVAVVAWRGGAAAWCRSRSARAAAEDAVARLTREWSRQVTGIVAVFVAADRITGGQPVEIISEGAVRARRDGHPAAGGACHDAAPGQLVAVAQYTGTRCGCGQPEPHVRIAACETRSVTYSAADLDEMLAAPCPCGLPIGAAVSGDPAAYGGFAARARRDLAASRPGDAEQLDHALACGDAPAGVVRSAQQRRPALLAHLPKERMLRVAASPGREYEAWHHAAPGVWIGRHDEPHVDGFFEKTTAGRLRRELRARRVEFR
jgi:hypothetical protein